MKFHYPKSISLIALISLLFAACGGGDGDDPQPDIENPAIITVLPSSDGTTTFTASGNFLYSGTFTDNQELAEVEFKLSNNQQTSMANLKIATGVDDEPWQPEAFKIDLSGDSQTMTNEVLFGESIPAKVWTGVYTLTITCTDKTGNTVSSSVKVGIS